MKAAIAVVRSFRSCETERLAEPVVCVVAIVPRVDPRTTGERLERRADRVGDSDMPIVTLDGGDRERVAVRQRWLPPNGLERERGRLDPLSPFVVREFHQRLSASTGGPARC